VIQGAALRVLACFYYANTRSFAELCETAGYPTDLGGYYIRQLVNGDYIEKQERGRYAILPKGKQALAFHHGKKMFAPHPRLAVIIIAEQDGKFVVLRRTAQPFIGTAEWPAAVVNVGESLSEAAARILKARLGIVGQPELQGFFRRIDVYKDTPFDDKLFAVHSYKIDAGAKLNTVAETGENILCTEEELRAVERPAKSLLDIFEYVQSGEAPFTERTYHLTAADLSL